MHRVKKYLKIPSITGRHLKKHIDPKLSIRLRMFFVIVLILIGLMLYDVFEGVLSIYLALGGFILGMIVGFFASRMSLIHWHEESAKVVSRIDAIGGVIMALYIIFAILRKWIFEYWLQGATLTAFTFSIIAGMMLGRLFGMHLNIRKVLLGRGIPLKEEKK